MFHSIVLKVQARQDLCVREARVLRKAYRRFRRAFDRVLADADRDETRTLAIARALQTMGHNELTAADFLAKVSYAYRQQGQVGGSAVGRMRADIAYRLALAMLFYRSQSVTSLLHYSPANAEFTYQILELDEAFLVYEQWQMHSTAASQAA